MSARIEAPLQPEGLRQLATAIVEMFDLSDDMPKTKAAIADLIRECADEIASRAGYEASGGGFRNALSKLRTLELAEGYGQTRASDALFG